jgi:hypothetical protein
VVVTDEAAGRTIPVAFLDKVKENFLAQYAEKGKQAKEGSITAFRWVVGARLCCPGGPPWQGGPPPPGARVTHLPPRPSAPAASA